MLVEDSSDDVELALRAFARSHIAKHIVVVRDGVEALDYLFRTGSYESRETGMPAVVLLDLQLPRIGGLDVLRRLKADDRTRRLPVVVLTSSAEESDIVRSYDNGANGFVRKPVDFEQFVVTAGQLGQYWLVVNEGPSR